MSVFKENKGRIFTTSLVVSVVLLGLYAIAGILSASDFVIVPVLAFLGAWAGMVIGHRLSTKK